MRIEKGKFYQQYFIIPAIGIKKTYGYDAEEIFLAFAWLNRGIAILIYTKKD